MSGSRRFNPGGDLDQDYARILLPSSVTPNNVTLAACFAREIDDGNFQNIAQFGTNGSNNSRALIGIPSSTDVFRASQGDAGGTFRSANTTGALTSDRFYVGCGRFASSTSRTAERTGVAAGSNTQASSPGSFDELLIARRGLDGGVNFESFPGWLRWVAFWYECVSVGESAALCQDWVHPCTIRSDALLAYADFSDGKGVLWSKGNFLWTIAGDPAWSTYGPYPIRTRRRRIFVPAAGGTQYNQSVGGTLSFAGGLVKQTSRALTGSISPAGAIAKQTSRSLSGSVDFAGNLASTAVFLKALDGAVSFAGALSKQTQKTLGGILSFSGSLVKQTGKNLSGSLSFAGNLLASFTTSKALTGVVSFAGNLATLLIPFVAGAAARTWRKVWQVFWREPGGEDE